MQSRAGNTDYQPLIASQPGPGHLPQLELELLAGPELPRLLTSLSDGGLRPKNDGGDPDQALQGEAAGLAARGSAGQSPDLTDNPKCTPAQCSLAQYSLAQYFLAQYSLAQYSLVQYSLAQYSLVQYSLA